MTAHVEPQKSLEEVVYENSLCPLNTIENIQERIWERDSRNREKKKNNFT